MQNNFWQRELSFEKTHPKFCECMVLFALSVIFVLIVAPLLIGNYMIRVRGARRQAVEYVKVVEAYTDCFEVLIIENAKDFKVSRLRLAVAEEAISQGEATFLVSHNKAGTIREQLGSEHDVYIGFDAEDNGDGSQIIELYILYSKSKYRYCYKAFKNEVIPLWSSVRDVDGWSKVIYNGHIANEKQAN